MPVLAAPRTRLHSGAPWWLVRDGLTEVASAWRDRCEVVVIGAGITGALVADALSAAGMAVVVFDRRSPGSGSTAVSTALLQYDLDTELVALADQIGEVDATRAYQLSASMIDYLDELTAGLPDRCGFHRRTSLYVASRRGHRRRLQAEGEARARAGLDATFIAAAEIRSRFDIACHGALCTNVAGVVDPLRLTRALLERARSRGAAIVPWTTVTSADGGPGGLIVRTDRGTIRAEHLVLACGYEMPPGLDPSVVELHGTYALITDPVEEPGPLDQEFILWESTRPYSYLRWVDDRVVFGGMDTPHHDAFTRDRLLPGRLVRLQRDLRRFKPGFDTPMAYGWAGTFGTTRDSLPVIGPLPGIERTYYALGYGGNGITFGALAAQLLRDLCLGRANPDAGIFRPDR